jgi:adenine deaminase
VAPGYEADIAVVDNLKDFNVEMVFKRGVLVAQCGSSIMPVKSHKIPIRSSVNVKWLEQRDLSIPVKGRKINVIDLVPGQIVTKKSIATVKALNGKAVSDTSKDILKIVVVERHLASGLIGKGFVRGFGLKDGAIASSVAHDSHNIIAVGADDESIFTAVVEVVKMGGGLAVAKGQRSLGKLPLPTAGLMSDQTLAQVAKSLELLIKLSVQLGVRMHDPFMPLSFLALPVIPDIKLTDKGLVDVNKCKLIDLFVK